MAMEQQTILVPLEDGTDLEVAATIYGRFAVHSAVEGSGYYTVTHIASGFAATKRAESKAAGLRLARMLARCGIDWNFVTPPSRLIGCKKGRDLVARWLALEKARSAAAVDPHVRATRA